MTQLDAVKSRSLRLLDYLSALALELTSTPKRRVADYDDARLAVRPDVVPTHAKVRLGPSSTDPAWLRVAKVVPPPPPSVPSGLVTYLPDRLDDPWTSPELPADFDERVRDRGGNPGELRASFARWLAEAWAPWADAAGPDVAAARLYQRLYDLRLRLQRDAATHELVWGHALMVWATHSEVIHHPLLLTSCLIEIDEDDGALTVVSDALPQLDLDPLQGLDLPGMTELAQLRDRVRSDPPDPWAAGGLEEVLRQIVAPLGASAQVLPGPTVPAAGAAATVVDTWSLFLRPRPARFRRFYAELAQVLEEGDALPVGLASVVADRETLDMVVGDDDAGDWTGAGERLLLPLEANEEQERIARLLARSRGVTVQGPPGTGKSHTIANLISHLVAHGKRVLVTAQNEQALSVLRDKIPPDLRDLSISVLGSSQASITELRASVQSIMDAVASIDESRETAAVERLGTELDTARTTLRQLNNDLLDLLADEAAEYVLPTGLARAAEVGRWLAEQERELARIPDRLPQTAVCPLSEADYAELLRLCADLVPADVAQATLRLPGDDPTDDLPTGGELLTRRARLAQLADELEAFAERGVELSGLDHLDESAQAQLLDELRAAAAELAQLEHPWLAAVREQAAQSAALAALWRDQAQALASVSSQLIGWRRRVFGRRVLVPEGDPREQLALLDEMKERFAAGRGLPKLTGKELRRLHEQLRVDDLELRTPDEVALVEAVVHERTLRAMATSRYGALVVEVHAPPLDPGSPDFPAGLEQTARLLQRALVWESTTGPALISRLRAVLPAVQPRPCAAELTELAGLLAAGRLRREQRRLREQHTALVERLEAATATDGASMLWGVLLDQLFRTDAEGWGTALEEARRLAALRPAIHRRDQLAHRLAAVAPLWAKLVLAERGDAEKCGKPELLPLLWRWQQAQSWFEDLLGHGDVAALQRRTGEVADEVRTLVAELGARSARLGVKQHLTDAQRRALQGWLQALKRIGKGTGKYAKQWQAEARAQMPEAMGAVPVWIMPVHRVLESFDPRQTELFDVVIVDESSQCNVLTTGLLALGRKVVVVGDDMQNSPQAVGVPRDKIFALAQSHLPFLAQRSLLDAEASLYDIAAQTFGDVVLLREHFRCLPEIIGFSNRFYDNRILPLREDPGLEIGPPLRPLRVTDGVRSAGQYGEVNEPEARALVEQVAACCADPAYAGMTFGVVTLLGSGQARLIEQLLLSRLGLDYERRRLRVGDPANFQGDERDVMFLSMVADDDRWAATRKADAQRINVAASRARNQMWLFHSVDAERLHPDDVRGQLLAYMYAAPTVDGKFTDLASRCESDFERAVLREMLERGYRVHPQFPVGNLRIDLVVQGAKQRLAVECDGDRYHGPEQWEADLRRQQVLERLGWTFWRVRGSGFYRNPNAALRKLWDRLAELDILPVTEADVADRKSPATPASPKPEGGAASSSSTMAVPFRESAVQIPKSLVGEIAVDTVHPAGTPHNLLDTGSAPAESDTGGSDRLTGESLSELCPEPILIPEQPQDLRTVGSNAEPPLATSGDRIPTVAGALVPADEAARTSPRVAHTATAAPALPEGMRHVAWIRPTEAAAVLKALANRRDQALTVKENQTPAVARYFPADSPEVRKFRAQVLVVRQRRDGERWVCWLREPEARAVVAAAQDSCDVPVRDADGRVVGLVTYHAADSEIAKKYRSTTRLLRPTVRS